MPECTLKNEARARECERVVVVRRGEVLVGVLSDTHIHVRTRTLPDEVLRVFRDVDLILHAGDFVRRPVLEALGKLAPVEAVRGNVDDPELRVTLPPRKVVELPGGRIGLVHGDGVGTTTLERARAAFSQQPPGQEVRCVVFGHSHQPYSRTHDGVLYLNPGSPTDPRWAPRPSYALLRVRDDGDMAGEIVWL